MQGLDSAVEKVWVLKGRRTVEDVAEELHRMAAAAGRTVAGCAERDRGLGGCAVSGRAVAA